MYRPIRFVLSFHSSYSFLWYRGILLADSCCLINNMCGSVPTLPFRRALGRSSLTGPASRSAVAGDLLQATLIILSVPVLSYRMLIEGDSPIINPDPPFIDPSQIARRGSRWPGLPASCRLGVCGSFCLCLHLGFTCHAEGGEWTLL